MRALRSFGRGIVRIAPLLAAVSFVLVVGWFGTRGQGPLGRVGFVRDLGGLGPVTEEARPDPFSNGTTPTTDGFYDVAEEPDMCMTWNQDAEISRRQTRRVVCDKPHLVEVADSFDLDRVAYGEDGPTDADYAGPLGEECDARIATYLGHPLDESSRFSRYMFFPFAATWRTGDRTIVCGLSVDKMTGPGSGTEELEEVTGHAADAPQTMRLPVGACYHDRPSGEQAEVPCTEAHDYEVIGTVEVDVPAGQPRPDTDAMYALTAAPCRALADQVYGGPTGADVGVEFLDVGMADWDAGERSVQCVMGRSDGSARWVTVVGPLRAAPPG